MRVFQGLENPRFIFPNIGKHCLSEATCPAEALAKEEALKSGAAGSNSWKTAIFRRRLFRLYARTV